MRENGESAKWTKSAYLRAIACSGYGFYAMQARLAPFRVDGAAHEVSRFARLRG
jgi:hypothetical protein